MGGEGTEGEGPGPKYFGVEPPLTLLLLCQLVAMMSDKCGEQTALVDSYKQQVERDNSRCAKFSALLDQIDALRYLTALYTIASTSQIPPIMLGGAKPPISD